MSDPWANRLLHRYDRLPEPDAVALRAHLEDLCREVVRLATPRPGELVLDLGAGTGMLTFLVAPVLGDTGRVVALDQSSGCLDEVRRLAQYRDGPSQQLPAPVRPVRALLPELPFADGMFDAVVVRSVLMYVADRRRAMVEIGRVLRPGGRLALFEMLTREDTRIADAFELSSLGPLATWVRSDEEKAIADAGDPTQALTALELEDAIATGGLTLLERRENRSPVPAMTTDAMTAAFLDRVLASASAPGHESLLARWERSLDPADLRSLLAVMRDHLGRPIRFDRSGVFLLARAGSGSPGRLARTLMEDSHGRSRRPDVPRRS